MLDQCEHNKRSSSNLSVTLVLYYVYAK